MEDINYEDIVQEHLRGVVRQVLEKTAADGLPGAHHFYITFRTDFPGVKLPDYLLERHPEEITIVIQYQFWGLEIDDNGFGITLSFSENPEKIYVPFYSLLSFMDPYAKFGLQFTPPSTHDVVEESTQDPSGGDNKDNVVTLDSFRKK